MTTGLQPYPEYKDSGLPWLNRIPARWEEKRAKFYFREVDERSTTGTEELMSVSHKTGVTPRKANVTMFMAESNVGCKICRPGDLVINTMWAWMAAMGVSRQTGLVSPSYGVYRPRKALPFLPDYVDHLVRTQPYVSEYICRSTGIRPSRLRLYPDDFLDIPIVCPPHEEQEAIVRFIGHHDRLVRRFIRNRRRLTGLLNEQKQAIINRAVTRGLDPHVPLKPSGIDWLGYVPEHWSVCRLKTQITLNDGGVWGSAFSDDGVIVLRSTEQTIDGHWRIVDPAKRVLTTREREAAALCEGDILVTKSSGSPAHIGKATLVSANIEALGCCFSNFTQRLRIRQGVDPRFIWYVLNAPLARKQFRYFSNSTTGLGNLSGSILGSIWLAMPPTTEQPPLLAQLGKDLHPFETAIANAQKETDLIREYRIRLIADVVTGKVDVRHLAPPPEAVEVEVEPDDLDEGLDDEMPGEDEAELSEEVTDADD